MHDTEPAPGSRAGRADATSAPSAPPGNATSVVLVNGMPQPWHPALTVADLLRARELDDAAVATAVNGVFVARRARATRTVAAGDDVLVFGAIVGG